MYYKYEMHSHTAACSDCGYDSAERHIDDAIKKGMSGIVFTNHFYHGNTCVDRRLPWRDFVGAYERDYLAAKEYSHNKNIDVFFGIEEVYLPGKEALIYGIEPEVFAACPEFRDMDIARMRDFVHENGGLIAAAHPFRRRGYIPNPDSFIGEEYFDAVEIYNYENTDEDNLKAEKYFKNSNILKISGSDIHGGGGYGFAGLAFTEKIKDNSDLVKKIFAGEYKLIINGIIE
jgi:hypothetical protein